MNYLGAHLQAEAAGGRVHWCQRRDARQTLCVFGHAVYLPSMALALAQQRGLSADNLDRVLDCNTAEASGYLVTADSVELLELE